jgi:hypothetical protein
MIFLNPSIIAAIMSILVSALVSFLVSKKTDHRHLSDQLDELLKISIQYPYLESELFAESWEANRKSQDDKYLRYDLYCTRLFNYFERLAKYHKYNADKIANDVAIKDWVRLHRSYWNNPPSKYENVDSYVKEFRDLIGTYLK